MADVLTGWVDDVVSSPRGAVVQSWTGTVALVKPGGDLDPNGGVFATDDGTQYTYTAVTVGDDADTVTMATAAPDSWPQPSTDSDGDTVPADVWVSVVPALVDVWADVDTGTDGVVRCVVSHALRPLLADGARDSGDREQVRCERVGLSWTVTDVIGRKAAVQLDGLADDVQQSIVSADGKTSITHSVDAPTASTPGVNVGDTWFQHDTSISGATIGVWSWDGSAWQQTTLNGAVLSNVDAGTVTSGSLSGIDMYSPSAADPSSTGQARAHIGSSQFDITRPTKDSSGNVTGQQVTTILGGATGDQLQFYDSDGLVKGGFDTDGVMTAQAVQAGSVNIAGTDIMDVAQAAPQGVLAAQNFTSGYGPYGTSETGVLDLQFTAVPGRLYRVNFTSAIGILANGSTSGNTYRTIVDFAMLVGSDGATTVAQPTVSTATRFNQAVFGPAPRAVYKNVIAQALWLPPTTLTQPTACRVLLTVFHQGDSSSTVSIPSKTGYFAVEDVGSTYTGTFADGNRNANAVQTYEKTFNVTTMREFDGSNYYSNTNEIVQGDRYGTQSYTMIWWPSDLVSALSGAQSISYVDVYLQNIDCSLSTGAVPRISPHTSASPPTAATGITGYDFDMSNVSKGGALWVRVPSSWYANIANGTWKGATFGLRVGQAAKYSGLFYSVASNGTLAPLQVRARWTK